MLKNFNLQFGGSVTEAHKQEYARSERWIKQRFRNFSTIKIDVTPWTLPKLIKGQLTNTKIRMPQKPIEVQMLNASAFIEEKKTPKFVWFGHSVLLFQLEGKNFLIDPMFGSDASPIAPIATKRFSENTLEIIDQLPHIEAIFFTHDHYDHLDFDSIQKLKNKVNTYFVGLGISRHLERWGVPKHQITEFDWWQSLDYQNIKITFVPSQHASGRGLLDQNRVLWGGWVFQSADHRIYWSGDGGYNEHFKTVGEKFGPFDWMFVECGQYNDLWKPIHLHPEQSVQATIDAKAKLSIPIHWGGFSLALHHWKEPIERFTAESKRLDTRICTPCIGELVTLGQEPMQQDWYKDLE